MASLGLRLERYDLGQAEVVSICTITARNLDLHIVSAGRGRDHARRATLAGGCGPVGACDIGKAHLAGPAIVNALSVLNGATDWDWIEVSAY